MESAVEATRDRRRAGGMGVAGAAGYADREFELQIFGYYGYNNCRTTWTRIAAPVRNPEQERLDAVAFQKEDAKWAAFCKPSFKADEHGVRRASYATPGCEFGQSE